MPETRLEEDESGRNRSSVPDANGIGDRTLPARHPLSRTTQESGDSDGVVSVHTALFTINI